MHPGDALAHRPAHAQDVNSYRPPLQPIPAAPARLIASLRGPTPDAIEEGSRLW
jgi:hypothetical protein